ncbi:hypothetical protein KY347_00995 [Candidatus Woesearchaeota archaeon]|nr:hypothetical protein [Candidatus Woesearchaeota archaeon]
MESFSFVFWCNKPESQETEILAKIVCFNASVLSEALLSYDLKPFFGGVKMKKKILLEKDSLSKIVKIMEYIEEYHGQINVNDIKGEFGENGWYLFSRYCIGTKEDYVTSVGNKGGTPIYTLTGVGIRKLHELRKLLLEEKRLGLQINTNIIIAITASVLTFIAALNLTVSLYGRGSIANQIILYILSVSVGVIAGVLLTLSLKFLSEL